MKIKGRLTVAGLLALLAVSAGAADALTATNSASAAGAPARKLVWSDEFNGTSLDTKRWNRCKKGGSDWNKHMSPRADLVEVKDGALVMWGVANTNMNDDPRPYLTGGVQSKHKGLMGLGKVEIRAKLEDHQKGAWPALWMLGDRPDSKWRNWPWAGEIDIMERLNSDPFVYQTVHSGWTHVKKHTKDPPHQCSKVEIKKGDWNVYGLEVKEDELVWSVNGKETFRYPKTDCGDPDQWPFGKPFYFLMDMQLGGNWVGEVDVSTLPVKMYIDWIRVYE
jgi:beta-glucanase (GH16 family)